MQPATIAHRYRVLRLLGEGGMGRVFEVVDLTSERRIALKLIDERFRESDENRLRFQYEYHRLAGLSHARILKAYDYGVWEGLPYFTMELCAGVDMDESAIDEPTVLRVALALTEVLAYLHQRNFVHRDLKPQNIRIETATGALKLMDFGLMTTAGMHLEGRIAGTPLYMAPEALEGQRIDHRSDLYSLGVLLYAKLSGRLPRRLTYEHQVPSLSRKPIAALPNTVGPRLQQLIGELLSVHPAGRPARTERVLHRLREIAGISADWQPVATLVRPPVAALDLVGRRAARAQLDLLAERAIDAGGGIICVQGHDGVGKSRLLEDFVLRQTTKGVRTFSFRAAHAEKRPFGALQGLFARLFASAQDKDKVAYRALHQVFEPRGDIGSQQSPLRDPQQELHGIQRALAALLRSLGAGEAGIILTVDDLAECDGSSLTILQGLTRPLTRLSCVLVCCWSTTHQAQVGTALPLDASETLRLDGLSHAELRELVGAIFGEQPVPPAFISWLEARSDGQPGAAIRELEQLVERGTIRFDDGRWYLPLDGWESPSAAGEPRVLPGPLLQLSDAARELAGKLSVAETLPLSIVEIVALTELPAQELILRLNELVERGVVVWRSTDLSFTRRTFARALYDALPESQRQALHDRLAGLLANTIDDPHRRARLLGFHLSRGATPMQAVEHLVAAGELSYAVRAFVDAVEPLKTADALLESADHPATGLRLRIWNMLGRIGFVLDPVLATTYFEKSYAMLRKDPWVRAALALCRVMPRALAVGLVASVRALSLLLRLRLPRFSVMIAPFQAFCTACAFLANLTAAQGHPARGLYYAEQIRPFAFDRRRIPWATYEVSRSMPLLCLGRFGEMDPLEQALAVYTRDRLTPIDPWDRSFSIMGAAVGLALRAIVVGEPHRPFAERLTELAEREDSDFLRGCVQLVRQAAAAMRGEWALSVDAQDRMFQYYRHTGYMWCFHTVSLIFACVNHYQSGRLAEARLVADEMRGTAYGPIFTQVWPDFHRAVVCGIEGNPEQALSLLTRLLEVMTGDLFSAHIELLSMVELARNHLALGQIEGALEANRRAREIASGSQCPSLGILAHVQLVDVEIALARGDAESAQTEADRALDLILPMGNPYLQALALFALGRAKRSVNRETSQRHLRHARDIFQRLENTRFLPAVLALIGDDAPPDDPAHLDAIEAVTMVDRPPSRPSSSERRRREQQERSTAPDEPEEPS